MAKTKPVWADEMSWKDFADLLKKTDMAVVPIGVMEAHGPHAPLGFDNWIAEEIAKRLALKLNALLMPVVKYGNCDVAYDATMWPGTISISLETMTSLYTDIGRELARQGIKRVIWVSGHFCNQPALFSAMYKVWHEWGTTGGILEYWVILNDLGIDKLFPDRIGGHADEVETSLLLATEGARFVDLEKAVANPGCNLPYPYKDEPRSTAYEVFMRRLGRTTFEYAEDFLHESGSMGDPKKASVEKGNKIIDAAVEVGVEMAQSLKRYVKTKPDRFNRPRKR